MFYKIVAYDDSDCDITVSEFYQDCEIWLALDMAHKYSTMYDHVAILEKYPDKYGYILRAKWTNGKWKAVI